MAIACCFPRLLSGRSLRRMVAVAVTSVASMSSAVAAQAPRADTLQPPTIPRTGFQGFHVYAEEDFFYGSRNMDRNYTGGAGIEIDGWEDHFKPYAVLDFLDKI